MRGCEYLKKTVEMQAILGRFWARGDAWKASGSVAARSCRLVGTKFEGGLTRPAKYSFGGRAGEHSGLTTKRGLPRYPRDSLVPGAIQHHTSRCRSRRLARPVSDVIDFITV